MSMIITQVSVFDYMQIEELGDLERITMCFSEIPMQPLIDALDKERKNGRNDYSNETMVKLLIVKKICQLDTVEKLRRELMRNPTLRRLCGLKDEDYTYGKKKLVPNAGVFSLFYKRLTKHQDMLDDMFAGLVDDMYDSIEGFGEHTAGDGKYLDSYAKNDHHKSSCDGRCDSESAFSIKSYHTKDKDGKAHIKKETHYGYREHVIVDTGSELPISFIVTPANIDEKKMMKKMLEEMEEKRLTKMKYLMLDRGYDSKDMLETIRQKGIKPIIDNRIMRKGDKTIQYKNTDIWYTESGECYYLDYGEDETESEKINEVTGLPKYFRQMKYEGYDKKRKSLRYSYKGTVHRIKITDDPRVFNEVARNAKKFKRLYNERTSVERYNGRIDRDYGMERHSVRGLKKMKVEMSLINIIMLVMAKAHIHKGQRNYGSMLKF